MSFKKLKNFITLNHKILYKGDSLENFDLSCYKEMQISELYKINNFLQKNKLASYVRKLKYQYGWMRSYIETKEQIIAKLFTLNEKKAKELSRFKTQEEQIIKLQNAIEKKRDSNLSMLGNYLRAEANNPDYTNKRIFLETQVENEEEHIQCMTEYRKIRKQIGHALFPDIRESEKLLKDLEARKEYLKIKTLEKSESLDIAREEALEVFYCILNQGFHSCLTKKHWNLLLRRSHSNQAQWIKNHFKFVKEENVYLLKDDHQYYSLLDGEYIYGTNGTNSLSRTDYNLKRILNKTLDSYDISSFGVNARIYMNQICADMLKNQNMSLKDQVHFVEIGKALSIRLSESKSIIADTAFREQTKFVTETLSPVINKAIRPENSLSQSTTYIMKICNEINQSTRSYIKSRILKKGIRLSLNEKKLKEHFITLIKNNGHDKVVDESYIKLLRK